MLKNLALIAVLVLGGAVAHAAHEDPDTTVARRHFSRGVALYRAGDWARALGEFEAAARARPLAGLDYDIARCLDRLERYPEAIRAYRTFIARTSSVEDASLARERVAVLTQRLDEVSPWDEGLWPDRQVTFATAK